jgi:hypothetical protein
LYPTIEVYRPPPQPFSLEEFQALRHHANEGEAMQQLCEIGCDISRIEPNRLTRGKMSRVCLLSCNTYAGDPKALGVGPLNDGIVVGANHKVMGYQVFFAVNATVAHFLNCVRYFLAETRDFLTVYFSGHGFERKTSDVGQASGFHEGLLLGDGPILDNVLADCLKTCSKGCAKTLLLTDCCHSGSVWDIPRNPEAAMQFPANIVSFAASTERETAKQATMANGSQGLFTFYVWKHLKENPQIPLCQLQPMVDESLARFNQHTMLTSTRPLMLTTPFFA